jgi:TonB-linked SusC/RagA family outer membrane protein
MQINATCENDHVNYYKRFKNVLLSRISRANRTRKSTALVKPRITYLFDALTGFKINRKLLLRMRIIIALLFVGFVQVHASTSAQNLTLNQRNTSLEKIFTEIKKQTGYLFFYNQEWIKLSKSVDINVKNAPLIDVLEVCFSNQPLTYSIVDKTIVLQLKKQPVLLNAPMADIDIRGQVKDEKGEVLPGVTVMIKGTKIGTQTNATGLYSLKVDNDKAVLVFSMVGYKTKEIAVDGRRVINISLSEAADQLSEVVVSGYTVQNRAEFTGSSSHVGSKQLENRPVPSFDQALAGQAAGVKITSSSGSLNSAPVFRIRGTNSITLSAYPLIIIDGVTSFTGDVGNSAENNPLSTLNTNDIESLEVLKDASATAIYGSRAANGVVVITTKKGKAGKVKVTYDGWYGVTKKPKLPTLLGADDYVKIKNESLVNIGSAPAYFIQYRPDGSKVETNWYDYVYQTGQSQNHNLSVAGGTGATHYFLSAGYSDQKGFLVKNTFERATTRFNIDHKLTKAIIIGANISYGNTLNNNLTSGFGNTFGLNNLVRESMVLSPNLSPFNDDGSYNLNGSGIGYGANTVLTGYYNPLPQLEHDKFTSESKSFLGNLFFELEIIKGLKAKFNYALNDLNTVNKSFSNPYQAGGFSSNGSATNSSSDNRRSDVTGTLNYLTSIAEKHNINALAGYQEIHTTADSWGVTKTNLNDRYYETFYGSYSTLSSSSGTFGENGLRSFFTSLFYDYEKKYLLTGSFRRDGMSALASGHKYGNFGGVSLGWNIAEEDFFKTSSLASTISLLKARASLGVVGNNNIGNYPSLSLYSSGVYGGIASLAASQTGNPDLHWERSKKYDYGLNVGLWNNRIVLDIDYYYNKIDELILAAPQAPSKGIPSNSITTNIGSMYNKGVEFNIEAHILDKGKFRWTSSFNISTLSNKVTSLAAGVNDIWTSSTETSNITRTGYSVGSVYVVETNGVNPANGLRTYINKAGKTVQYNPVGGGWTYLDGTTAPALDAYADGVIYGNTLPKYYGGFNNTFNYKSIDMTINIVFSGGNKIYNGTKATLLDNRFFNNQVDILRRWTTPGQITDIPKVNYNDQNASGSVLPNSFNVEDGSYIKLGTAAIGYRLPANLCSKLGISTARIYGSAGNFILYTKYTGSDPEISANADSNTAAGRDKNSVPAGKTFTLGLTVGF